MDTETVGQDGRTQLATIIRQRRPSRASFAKEIKCSQSHLSLILAGKRGMSLKLAKRISEALDGEIPIAALPHAKVPEIAE